MSMQLHLCNECTTLIRDGKDGEAIHVGREGIWEHSVTSIQFSCEPQTALKDEVMPRLLLLKYVFSGPCVFSSSSL